MPEQVSASGGPRYCRGPATRDVVRDVLVHGEQTVTVDIAIVVLEAKVFEIALAIESRQDVLVVLMISEAGHRVRPSPPGREGGEARGETFRHRPGEELMEMSENAGLGGVGIAI